MKKTLKFTDEDFENVFPRLELENVEDVIPPIDNTSDKIPPAVGIHKADEQPIVVKLPYEIENQGLYTDPKEKGIIGALGESVWQGVKSNGTAFVNNMDTLAYRGLEKQKKEAEKYLSNHDDLVSEIYKKNIDKFGENGSYADFLKKNIVENTQKQSQNSQAIAEKYADIKGAGTAQYVGEAVGTMLPGIGASIATGIPNIGLAFMAPNVFGNAMGRAVSDGADMKKAQSYALADTALEVGIEMLFGGIPSFGEGMISAKNLTSKYLKTTAGRFLANKLVDVTGEGLEEVASEILEPFLERAFIDNSAPNANLKEVAKAFGGGVLISSILGAANISNEINEAKPNAKNYTVASQEYEPQSDKWFGNISDITQARKAYKRYAQEYHPDVSSQTNAAQIMGEINRAYTGWRKYAAQQQYNLGETTDSSKTASKQADTNGSTISLLNAGRAEKAVNSLPDGAKMIGRETQGIIQRFGKDSLVADKLTTQNVATIPQAENVQPTSNKITIQPKEDKLNGYISTLEGVKATNAKTSLEGVKGDITKAQFVENNIDDDFILDNKLYYSVNNGKKVPITKAMYDYAQYLKGENFAQQVVSGVDNKDFETVKANNDTALTEKTTVNDNSNTHTAQEMKVIEEYKNAVDPDLVEFVRKVKNGAKKVKYVISTDSDRANKKALELTGLEKVGDDTVIDDNAIIHIEERHGLNGEADHTMAKDEDIARIKYVLDNFDNAYLSVEKAQGYSTKNGKPAPIVIFEKKIDGTYIIIEATSDSKKNCNFIVSAYMSKKRIAENKKVKVEQQPSMSNNIVAGRDTAKPLTPVTFTASKVPHSQEIVNSPKMPKNVSTQKEPLRFAGTGEVASDKANDVLSRLAKGERVSVEEINSIPEVALARNIKRATLDTSKINTQKRAKLRKKVAETVNNYGSAVKTTVDGKPFISYNGDIRQDKRADIVIGLPASGKSSTLVDPLSEKYKARVVDSDMVKELLPEFDNGYGAGVVHEESKGIAKKWLATAIINGDNIVYPIVGSDISKVLSEITTLKQKGYTVNLHLNELPNEKATGRMLKRFFTDNRFLDPNLMTKYGNKPTQVYNAIKELEGYIDGYSRYSNDVEYGQEPRLVETSLLGTNDRGDDGGQPVGKFRGNNSRDTSGNEPSQGRTGQERQRQIIKDTPVGVSSSFFEDCIWIRKIL